MLKFLHALILLCFFVTEANTKDLPPGAVAGSGTNILILLDVHEDAYSYDSSTRLNLDGARKVHESNDGKYIYVSHGDSANNSTKGTSHYWHGWDNRGNGPGYTYKLDVQAKEFVNTWGVRTDGKLQGHIGPTGDCMEVINHYKKDYLVSGSARNRSNQSKQDGIYHFNENIGFNNLQFWRLLNNRLMGCNYNDYTKKLTLVHSFDNEYSKKDLRVTVFDYGVMSDFDCEEYYKQNQLNYKQKCPAWGGQTHQTNAKKQEGYQIMEVFDRRAYTDGYGKGGTLNKTNDGLIAEIRTYHLPDKVNCDRQGRNCDITDWDLYQSKKKLAFPKPIGAVEKYYNGMFGAGTRAERVWHCGGFLEMEHPKLQDLKLNKLYGYLWGTASFNGSPPFDNPHLFTKQSISALKTNKKGDRGFIFVQKSDRVRSVGDVVNGVRMDNNVYYFGKDLSFALVVYEIDETGCPGDVLKVLEDPSGKHFGSVTQYYTDDQCSWPCSNKPSHEKPRSWKKYFIGFNDFDYDRERDEILYVSNADQQLVRLKVNGLDSNNITISEIGRSGIKPRTIETGGPAYVSEFGPIDAPYPDGGWYKVKKVEEFWDRTKFPLSGKKFPILKPTGVHIGKSKIYLVDAAQGIYILNKDLTYHDLISKSGQSIAESFTNSIKSLVRDPAINAVANFGFGFHGDHEDGVDGFKGWQNGTHPDSGESKPCLNSCIKVAVDAEGASKVNIAFQNLPVAEKRDARSFSTIANEYYNDINYSPIQDGESECENHYVIVVTANPKMGWENHSTAVKEIESLRKSKNVKTVIVSYGSWYGVAANQMNAYAIAGGTDDLSSSQHTKFLWVRGGDDLKTKLRTIISEITVDTALSYSAPAITAETSDTGSLYQAQFKYVPNKQWEGTLRKTKINKDGSFDSSSNNTWSANDMLPSSSARKIWTAVSGSDYRAGYNNFTEDNISKALTELYGFKVAAYHNKGDTGDANIPENTLRCKGATGVEDGNEDDVKGLINFIRGADYFDYDGDCNLTEDREHILGDIYHSNVVVVGPPNARTSSSSKNDEAYYRSTKGYKSWADSLASRQEVIYAGANDGMLHAFDKNTGKELWGFVPPLLIPKLATMVNDNLNRLKGGGSTPIYSVDGPITIHDMYFKSDVDNEEKWRTILMLQYGRGGQGFSVLDITDPLKPLHLYSIFNDNDNEKVYLADANGLITNKNYSTIENSRMRRYYDYRKLGYTTSAARIARIPNSGAGDKKIDDDIYVAIMGGGYGVKTKGLGSSLFVINLADFNNPGSVEKIIDVPDIPESNIVNSLISDPVVITPDNINGAKFRGAIVYTSDLEGKITKYNLTNYERDNNGNKVEMYDNYVMFWADSTTQNDRYMFNSMDATIGQKTKSLWLLAGTGNIERINRVDPQVQNLMLGINDSDFPYYSNPDQSSIHANAMGPSVITNNKTYRVRNLIECENNTNPGSLNCPEIPDKAGWYVTLKDSAKVSAEPTSAYNVGYFPLYRPNTETCKLGDAFACGLDAECGINYSSKLGNHQNSDQCFFVGTGVLTKFVFYKNKLYANIAGQSTQTKKDLVVLDTFIEDLEILRGSWRENF